jgi:hypothetical protein
MRSRKTENSIAIARFCCGFNADSIEWFDRRRIGFVDSTGDLDYGNIDSFVRVDGAYTLSGDWGRVIIRGGEVEAVITD